jgi:hypothetical protein
MTTKDKDGPRAARPAGTVAVAIGTVIGLSLYPVLAWVLLEALRSPGF